MEYDIVWAEANPRGAPEDAIPALRKLVRKKLKKGWVLHGTLFFYNGALCQAMTRTSESA